MTTEGYLRRIGVDPGLPPTVETLRLVHRAHLDAVPYENFGIMLANATGGVVPSVDTHGCVTRVAETGRAGYCFHQNAALGAGLAALGFDVSRRHGHVWTLPEHRDLPDLNHLVLVVAGLPTDDNPGGLWWPDAGLGEGFRDPVALVDGPIVDGGFAYSVDGATPESWSFSNDPSGTFVGMQVTSSPVTPTVIEAAHLTLSTPPDGHFARILVVQRRQDSHYDALRGCVLSRVTARGVETRDVTSYDDWLATLVDVVRVPVADVSDVDLRRLWSVVREAHDRWDAAGRP